MEKIWSDHINSETERLNANQARIDKLEKRGLSKAQFADVRRLTDALHERIKRSESLLVEFAEPVLDRLDAAEARIKALETQFEATGRKGFHVTTTDSSNHARA
ncbi:hypothetical protein [Cupriavidus oxalaticus]|uniref:Uncharacterized protein n=1 Tax=Cupriavidus oxalaticus TaxID=96344 RepID=A0A4P7L9K7_9BURK|nr:hypothetical protein [Cupriavidus oxalaticus]QBY52526.1 hypothetical protein E0W60_15155 [Cupriavidus oxalaticus]